MSYSAEKIAKVLFEISSEQRLKILFELREKNSTVSVTAKKLNSTIPEVFRNFERLAKAGLIEKEADRSYSLTLHGKTICTQIPSLVCLSQHEKYFINHTFGNIPTKYIQRIGALFYAEHIKGVVKVLEQWKGVYKNAEKYIFNVLSEVPYTKDMIDELVDKIKKGVKVKSVFSESAIIPKERKEILDKINFKKYIEEEALERRMLSDVKIALILNEKEACIMFPNKDGEVDLSEMLYSSDAQFHEWCLDYFNFCWERSNIFQERKLK